MLCVCISIHNKLTINCRAERFGSYKDSRCTPTACRIRRRVTRTAPHRHRDCAQPSSARNSFSRCARWFTIESTAAWLLPSRSPTFATNLSGCHLQLSPVMHQRKQTAWLAAADARMRRLRLIGRCAAPVGALQSNLETNLSCSSRIRRFTSASGGKLSCSHSALRCTS